MKTVLISAPYMLPEMKRFRPVLEAFDLDLITPTVHERLSEEEILVHAGAFDGVICGDDRFTRRVIEACLPRLKVISKWERASIRLTGLQRMNWAWRFAIPQRLHCTGI